MKIQYNTIEGQFKVNVINDLYSATSNQIPRLKYNHSEG